MKDKKRKIEFNSNLIKGRKWIYHLVLLFCIFSLNACRLLFNIHLTFYILFLKNNFIWKFFFPFSVLRFPANVFDSCFFFILGPNVCFYLVCLAEQEKPGTFELPIQIGAKNGTLNELLSSWSTINHQHGSGCFSRKVWSFEISFLKWSNKDEMIWM